MDLVAHSQVEILVQSSSELMFSQPPIIAIGAVSGDSPASSRRRIIAVCFEMFRSFVMFALRLASVSMNAMSNIVRVIAIE